MEIAIFNNKNKFGKIKKLIRSILKHTYTYIY